MSLAILESLPRLRLRALLDHLGTIEDAREPRRVAVADARAAVRSRKRLFS